MSEWMTSIWPKEKCLWKSPEHKMGRLLDTSSNSVLALFLLWPPGSLPGLPTCDRLPSNTTDLMARESQDSKKKMWGPWWWRYWTCENAFSSQKALQRFWYKGTQLHAFLPPSDPCTAGLILSLLAPLRGDGAFNECSLEEGDGYVFEGMFWDLDLFSHFASWWPWDEKSLLPRAFIPMRTGSKEEVQTTIDGSPWNLFSDWSWSAIARCHSAASLTNAVFPHLRILL